MQLISDGNLRIDADPHVQVVLNNPGVRGTGAVRCEGGGRVGVFDLRHGDQGQRDLPHVVPGVAAASLAAKFWATVGRVQRTAKTSWSGVVLTFQPYPGTLLP